MTQQQKTSLKQATQDYYEDIELSDTQFDELDSLLKEHRLNKYKHKVATNTSANDNKTSKYRYATIACVCLALFLTVTALVTKYDVIPKKTSMLVAQEVATNHMHVNPLEIKSDNFSQVADYFSHGKISFKPIRSQVLNASLGSKLSLLGGRFCSLRNTNASLIRYQAPQNHILTFYQVGYDAKKFGNIPSADKQQTPMEAYVNGIKVNLWVEKGLLMASAVDATCNI